MRFRVIPIIVFILPERFFQIISMHLHNILYIERFHYDSYSYPLWAEVRNSTF